MFPLLQRLTAWLCLATALLAGSTPAQGFVVCLEPGGRISVELATADAGCSGCIGHEEGSTPAALEVPDCPCVDLQLPVSPETTRVLPAWTPLPPAPRVACAPVFFPSCFRAPPDEPRPPDSLACTRTVVLLL